MHLYLIILIAVVLLTLIVDISLWILARPYINIKSAKLNLLYSITYWSVPLLFFICLAYFVLASRQESAQVQYYYHFTMFNGVYLLFYIPKFVMALYFGIVQLYKSINGAFKDKAAAEQKKSLSGISRAQFLGTLGSIIGLIPFASIIYGLSKGRFNFSVIKHAITIKDLPEGLQGLKIIQLSDLHLGNFNYRYDMLYDVVETINKLKPDLIFITGDLVNNFASETKGWEKVFTRLESKYGNYAILGNHDYGDYSNWDSPTLKAENFSRIKESYQNFGFKLLLNANEKLKINGAEISIIGVENWGHPPFPQYGNLRTALKGDLAKTKILLTHDPDHWEAEVLGHTDIDLSLSGHTHGMQMGLKFKNKQWSPAQWKYKYWGGWYQVEQQQLYVNRGLGYIGIPIRVGMPPEVTLLTLKA